MPLFYRSQLVFGSVGKLDRNSLNFFGGTGMPAMRLR